MPQVTRFGFVITKSFGDIGARPLKKLLIPLRSLRKRNAITIKQEPMPKMERKNCMVHGVK